MEDKSLKDFNNNLYKDDKSLEDIAFNLISSSIKEESLKNFYWNLKNLDNVLREEIIKNLFTPDFFNLDLEYNNKLLEIEKSLFKTLSLTKKLIDND